MNLLSLFAFTVYAAGAVISPIPDDIAVTTAPPPKPEISFGQIVETAPTPTPEVLATTTIAPTPTPLTTKKKAYTIAFLGDSMTDTMGLGLPDIESKLTAAFPATNFTLVNYGLGATNLDDAIARIPWFAATRPEIVVLESCAYNPYPNETTVTRHWLALAKAVDTLRSTIPGVKIVVAATIAPNSTVFGDGAPGIAFNSGDKISRTSTIKQYLENTIKFAQSQNLPLADAYHASLTPSGEGNLAYINNGDHIHYSGSGRALFAEKVVRAIRTVL